MTQAMLQMIQYPGRIAVYDCCEQVLALVKQKYNVQIYPTLPSEINNLQAVILAIKPQDIESACSQSSHVLTPQCLLVSIVAGITVSQLKLFSKHQGPIIRAMPNTPAKIGKSATVLFGQSLTDENKKFAQSIFNQIGKLWWIEQEELLHAVTAISGSGPAYLFYFMKAWQEEAEALGLSSKLARDLIAETIQGALVLANDNNSTLDNLLSQVISKRGTTESAINYLDHHDISLHFRQALNTAYRRSQKLSERSSNL